MEAQISAAKTSLKDPELVNEFERAWRKKLRAHYARGARFRMIRRCGVLLGAMCLTFALYPFNYAIYEVLSNDDPTVSKVWELLTRDILTGKLLREEECWVERSQIVNDFFRPVVNCTFCEGVREMRRVKTLTPKEFLEKHAFTGTPLVVTGEAKDWPALKVYSYEFLQKLYNDVLPANHIEMAMDECNFFRYHTKMLTLEEVFKEVNTNSTFYVGWSNCDSSAVKLALRELYRQPRFLNHPDILAAHTDWVFVGTPGPGAPGHYDAIFDPSWQAQITGRKKWDIDPPPECAHTCHSISTTVEPGEVVVIDTHRWYHKTTALPPDLSITVGSEFYRAGATEYEGYIIDEWDFLDDGRVVL